MEEKTLAKSFEIIIDAMPKDSIKKLLHAILMKRSFDGLNGRIWDAQKHLEYEMIINKLLDKS